MDYAIVTNNTTGAGGRLVGYYVMVYEIVGWDKSPCGEEGCYQPGLTCSKFRAFAQEYDAAIKKATDWIKLQERVNAITTQR